MLLSLSRVILVFADGCAVAGDGGGCDGDAAAMVLVICCRGGCVDYAPVIAVLNCCCC